MEKKINLAELLKDCPQGMELDCAMYDNVQLNYVLEGNVYPIKVQTPDGQISLNKYGCYSGNKHAKCVIFPKGKTTWEGFVPPIQFKDGDIVCNIENAIIIYREISPKGYCGSFVSLDRNNIFIPHYLAYLEDTCRLATEEEKQKLFNAIKANGYKWNPETKTLEKLVEPKFKVGDRVKRKEVNYTHIVTIVEIDGEYYTYVNQNGEPASISIKNQDKWELVPNKFDITTLKPFESRVLVRDYDNQIWIPTFWGKYLEDSNCRYLTANGCYKYCIPYEGSQHLLGTTDDCDEYYKIWE